MSMDHMYNLFHIYFNKKEHHDEFISEIFINNKLKFDSYISG